MDVSVSVIIPCYRSAMTIERAIRSVASQTLLPKEVILIDDKSNDGTLQLLYSLQKEYGSHWVKIIELPRNLGPSAARNAGWDEADSRYVAFLDSDDSWHPQKIEIQYQWMCAHPEVVMTGHCISIYSDNIEVNIDKATLSVTKISRIRLLLSNVFSTPTVMIRNDFKIRFDPQQRCAEDYLLWLMVVCREQPVFHLDAKLAYMYKAAYGDSGLSGNLWIMEKGELYTYRKLYRLGLISFFSYKILSIYSLAKYCRRYLITCWTRFRV